MAGPVRSLAVIGRDAAAFILALGLKRALAPIGLEVTLIELPSALLPGSVHSALPSLGNLHTLLGLSERALFARCGATPVLGQQYVGWSTEGAAFIHGYDTTRPAINDVDFLQFWSLARRQGLRVAFEDFSLAAAAAKQGRVVGAAEQGAAAGYHIDARAYATLLRAGCARAGIPIRPTSGVDPEWRGDKLTAVRIDDGAQIESDLFVDASGIERALIGGHPDAAFDSWTHWFPADRGFVAAAAPITPPPAYARIAAVADGWVGLFPLQDETAITGRFRSLGRSDEEAAARMLESVGVPAHAVTVRSGQSGSLVRSWIGNCVAVGDAAAVTELLDAVELQLLQVALSTLAAYWPVDRDHMPEARAYDRAVQSHLANIRDFQLLHYRLSDRQEPFWRHAREASASDRLDARLRLFAARGIIPGFDDETFLPQSWAATMIGHGVIPAESDPAVERTPPDEQMQKVQRLLQLIAAQVRDMPSIADHIATQRAARA